MPKKKPYLCRLFELKKGAEIHGLELRPEGKGTIKDAVIVFDHVDGMYSYNTVRLASGEMLTNDDGSESVVHLANGAWLKQVGDHYVMATEEEIEKYGRD